MSEYSPEFSKMKAQISAKIQEYIEMQIAKKKAGIKVHGNEPKMALRAQRSLVSSTDETFAALVEEALSKDWDGEKIKNKIRSLIEKRFPDSQKLIPTDRIHHRNALEMLGPLAKQNPEIVFGALKILEDEGEFFGDSWQNTKGSSFDERAHSGAMPKDSKSKIIYPRKYGEEGLRDISGHPMGTKDSRMPIEDRIYETPEELAGAIREKLKYSRDSYARAEFAAKDQRRVAQGIAKAAGVTEDIYSTDISPEGLKKAQNALKTAEAQTKVASAFKTPTLEGWQDFMGLNGYKSLSGSGFVKWLKSKITRNPIAGGVGATLATDGDAIAELIKGNPKEAAVQAGTGLATGSVIGEGAKRLASAAPATAPYLGAAGQVLAPVAAIDAGAKIGVAMRDNVAESTHVSGRGAGRQAFAPEEQELPDLSVQLDGVVGAAKWVGNKLYRLNESFR